MIWERPLKTARLKIKTKMKNLYQFKIKMIIFVANNFVLRWVFGHSMEMLENRRD